jgi:hypothetical protein
MQSAALDAVSAACDCRLLLLGIRMVIERVVVNLPSIEVLYK